MHTAAALAIALLAGCGGASVQGRAHRARHMAGTSSASRPLYSAAKRRYLVNFKTDCASATSGADQSVKLIQQLIDQIGAGNAKALPKLILYLNRLAGAFEASLHRARSFGAPPNPGSAYGRAYFEDSAEVVSAIRSLGQALTRIEPKRVGSAIESLKVSSTAAVREGNRYGMPTCASKTSIEREPVQSGPAI